MAASICICLYLYYLLLVHCSAFEYRVFQCSAFVERQGEEASHSAGKSSQRPVAKQRTALHCTSVFVFVVPR